MSRVSATGDGQDVSGSNVELEATLKENPFLDRSTKTLCGTPRPFARQTVFRPRVCQVRSRSLLFVVTLLSGCGTVHTQIYYFSDGALSTHSPVPPNLVYGGVTTDAMMIGLCFYAPFAADAAGDRGACPFKGFMVAPCALFFVADLPLSLAADTAILPMTLGQEIAKGLRRPTADGPPNFDEAE